MKSKCLLAEGILTKFYKTQLINKIKLTGAVQLQLSVLKIKAISHPSKTSAILIRLTSLLDVQVKSLVVELSIRIDLFKIKLCGWNRYKYLNLNFKIAEYRIRKFLKRSYNLMKLGNVYFPLMKTRKEGITSN